LAPGLIHHFCHDPLPLELTLDASVFNRVDDSNEKLSLDTFFLVSF
jgi:hypothetical protein